MAMGSIYIIYYITGNSKIYCVLLIYRTCYKTNTPAQFPTKPTPPNINSNRTNTTQHEFQQNQHHPTENPTKPTPPNINSNRTNTTQPTNPKKN